MRAHTCTHTHTPFTLLFMAAASLSPQVTIRHPVHGETTHEFPPKLESAVCAAGSDARAAAHLVSIWLDALFTPLVKMSQCDVCHVAQAESTAMNVQLRRVAPGEAPEPDQWFVSYLLCCSAKACFDAAHMAHLEVEKQERAGQDQPVQKACIRCLRTTDLLRDIGDGAYYCPDHRLPSCAACHTVKKGLARCACNKVFYCNKACQLAHRATHKPACKK